MRFLFTIPVWGERYIANFMQVSVPTLLAPGNLPDFPWLAGSRFQFVTTPESESLIRAAPTFKRLEELLEVRFELVRSLQGSKYNKASFCQNLAIASCTDFDGICFLYADIIWAQGSLSNAARRIAQGYEAVFVPGPPVLADHFPEVLRAHPAVKNASAGTASMAVPPRALAEVALARFHPAMEAYRWDAERFTTFPAFVTWEVPGSGLVLHPFHLHPVLMRVPHHNPAFFARIRISLDEEFVTRVYKSGDRVYCVRDSDEVALVTLMDRDGMRPVLLRPEEKPDAAFVARWAEQYAALLHREFFRRPYRLHTDDIDEERWLAVETRSGELVEEVLRRLAAPDRILRTDDPEAFLARRARARRLRSLRKPALPLSPIYNRMASGALAQILIMNLRKSAGGLFPIKLVRWIPGFWALHRWAHASDGLIPVSVPRIPSHLLAYELLRRAVRAPDHSERRRLE